MPAITVNNITKTFHRGQKPKQSLKEYFLSPFSKPVQNTFKAVNDVSFEIKKGEFFGIIGRNGSGKSTMLKMLAGIYAPDQGEIISDGKVVPFLELGVGFNPELTARENVFLNGTILGMTRSKVAKKFDEIIDFAEVNDFVDTQLKNFSSGMQVRLAFAIAMQAEADIYLVDEILAVGDFAFQQKCFQLFKELKTSGKTFVLVSHDLGSVREFCDRTMYMKGGKLVSIGKTTEIISEYITQDREREKGKKEVDFGRDTEEGGRLEVEVLDEGENVVNNIVNDQSITVRVHYELTEEALKDKLIAGFGIFKDGDFFIFGTNSMIEDAQIDFKKKGHIDFKIKQFPLLQGHYNVSAAIHNPESHHYVWKDNATYFDVIQNHPHDGLVNMEVEISSDA